MKYLFLIALLAAMITCVVVCVCACGSRSPVKKINESRELELTAGFHKAEIAGTECYISIQELQARNIDIEPENVKLKWSAQGSMVVSHDFDCTNCAFELSLVEYRVGTDAIEIVERAQDDEGIAMCRCYNSARYTLTDIPPGEYHLSISKQQFGKPYLSFEAEVSLPADKDERIVEHRPVVEMCGFEIQNDSGEWAEERLREFEQEHGLAASGSRDHR